MDGIVEIEITEALPAGGSIGRTYRIEGTVKAFDVIGAPPWVYAEVRKKEWYQPGFIEETNYERGFPLPISGEFTIDWKPEKLGSYEISIIATPAPLSLPMIGVQPVVGKSDIMKIDIGEELPGNYSGVRITSYEKVAS